MTCHDSSTNERTAMTATSREAAASCDGPRTRRRRRRAGFSILEAQVAFIMLGIALAGVCPLIVMQVKLSKRVTAGFDQNGQLRPGGRTFLVMQTDRWPRKLGAAAGLSANPGSGTPTAAGSYKLSLLDPVTT